MNTDKSTLILEKESHAILGAAMALLYGIGLILNFKYAKLDWRRVAL
jgi:hypothetical protein